jgi:hypothetical protein
VSPENVAKCIRFEYWDLEWWWSNRTSFMLIQENKTR